MYLSIGIALVMKPTAKRKPAHHENHHIKKKYSAMSNF
jgi:hypothetical protein